MARLNPVVLEFWKRVLFSSDEFVDLTLVKVGPQILFLPRKIVEMEVFTAQKLEAIDVNFNCSSSFMAEILIGSASQIV